MTEAAPDGGRARAGDPARQPDEARLATLLARLDEQAIRLAKSEFALAALEAKQRGLRAAAGVAGLALAGLLAFFGAAALVAAAILAMATVLPPWAAAIVIGVIAVLCAGLVGGPAMWAMLRAARGVGRAPIARITADVRAIRAAARR